MSSPYLRSVGKDRSAPDGKSGGQSLWFGHSCRWMRARALLRISTTAPHGRVVRATGRSLQISKDGYGDAVLCGSCEAIGHDVALAVESQVVLAQSWAMSTSQQSRGWCVQSAGCDGRPWQRGYHPPVSWGCYLGSCRINEQTLDLQDDLVRFTKLLAAE